ncbi:MAG: SCO family protein [Chloroflexi bacterium]|nr:SCO family protein [Chloroflexota bacterium]
MKNNLLRGFYGLLIILVASALAFKIFQPIKVLPRIRLAPAFDMIDQDWARLTSEDLRGYVVIYTFAYTNCVEPCYHINETMKEIQARLSETKLGNVKTAFVTISFDPQHDSPTALRAYARNIGADTQQWKFVTTPNESLLKAIIGSGFQTYYEQKPDGSYAFDPAFILVDGWGVIRGEYRYQTEISTADRILRHLGVLSQEVQNAAGPTKLAYEAAHVFLCYAP